jgi:DNA-binding transcriptional LysR family regulator
MLDTSKLLVLRAVAEHGSIAGAARELGYTRSAVSQQMSALERSAGVSLLIRGGKTVTLTPLGRRLLEHTERILVELRAAESAMRQSDGVAGRLKIGIPFREGPPIMSTALTKVRQRYPRLEVSLVAISDQQGAEEVKRGRLDVVILSTFGAIPPLPEAGLRQWILGCDRLSLCTPLQHPLADLETCRMEQLRDESWVVYQNHPLSTVLLGLCSSSGYRPRVAATVGDVATALGLVGVGWGLTIAPDLTPGAPESSIKRIALDGVDAKRYSVLVCRDGEQDIPEIEAVVTAVHTVTARTFTVL